MSDLTDETKLQIVSGFLKDSPPGEINDVFNDVRVLMDDEALLENGAVGFFEEYNVAQFTTVVPPGQSYNTTSDPQPAETDSEAEAYRAKLDEAAERYVADHFPDGTTTVYANGTVAIVDNKYNPNSFWNGRWRSQWAAPHGATEIAGTIQVAVHYYEDGNVQLAANKDISVTVSPSPDPAAHAAAVLRAISKAEAEFQASLSGTLGDLADSIFKTLRRGLPITRNKINWDSIATYKIGSELSTK
ncbi:hypothetical protein HKX48_003422 [Thoreauomyces humboldtii]|nr:hypothetical protein HKX48_003422 [Thoreauomyces humboldtii]